MNLSKLAVVPIACVAAIIVLSGCIPNVMAEGPNTPAPSAEGLAPEPEMELPPGVDSLEELFAGIDITRPDPNGPTDEWVNWTAGRNEQLAVEAEPYLAYLSSEMGVEGFETTNDTQYKLGYFAVAPFGDYCIVALLADELSATDGAFAVSVVSRINLESEFASTMTSDYKSLGLFADFYREWCSEGGDWPGFPPPVGSGTPTDNGVNA